MIADQLAVEVQLMQVAAAVVQVVQVLAGGQSQGGQVAERVVFVDKGGRFIKLRGYRKNGK
ncbi:hypothetical protein [Pseudomonas alliivorans]